MLTRYVPDEFFYEIHTIVTSASVLCGVNDVLICRFAYFGLWIFPTSILCPVWDLRQVLPRHGQAAGQVLARPGAGGALHRRGDRPGGLRGLLPRGRDPGPAAMGLRRNKHIWNTVWYLCETNRICSRRRPLGFTRSGGSRWKLIGRAWRTA